MGTYFFLLTSFPPELAMHLERSSLVLTDPPALFLQVVWMKNSFWVEVEKVVVGI